MTPELGERVSTGDAVLDCRVAGAGPVVLCVHGFPDCAASFAAVTPALVGAGYRVVCPATRGYAPSGPAPSGRYDVRALGEDLVALARHFSPEAPVRLVGHDWGALAGYAATALAPERFSHLATLAVPHLGAAAWRFATAAQLRRSAYIGLFQLRGLAEWRLRARDFALVLALWRRWSPGWACPRAHLDAVKAALRPHPSAVLAYYRALPRALVAPRSLLFRRTRVRSLYLHGARDGCIGVELARGLEAGYAGPFEAHVLPGVGHFLHLEAPDAVGAHLVRFLARGT
ncbi:MAG: alpha/beta hydrolase [Myxococcales bacterium]|nr:alpha/beta hydrolase [Myxococcales bacterium]